jgi:hypothetical protein
MTDEELYPCNRCIFNGYPGCSEYSNPEDECPNIQKWLESKEAK